MTVRLRPSGVRAPTLTVDDGGRQDGSHGGLLRQELDAVQQPCRVHALAQRHVVHRLQPRVKVHGERHQLLALHHVFGGGAPQLATCAEQTGDVQVSAEEGESGLQWENGGLNASYVT